MVKYLTKDDDYFEIVSTGVLLVVFYADYCLPCKLLDSILEEIDYINIIKVDVEEYSNIASKFGINSVPTICFYKDGLLIYKEIGYRTPEEIKELYNKIINKESEY